MDFKNLTRKEFEEWKSHNPKFKNIDFEGFKKHLIKEQKKGNLPMNEAEYRNEVDYQKDQIIKYTMYTTIGLGIFFPPIWIATILLFFYRAMRK